MVLCYKVGMCKGEEFQDLLTGLSEGMYMFGATARSFLLVPCSVVITAAVGNTHKQILLISNSDEYYHSATMKVVHHFKNY